MTQDMLMAYFQKSTVITIVVLGWLSLYFIITFTILISRVIGLSVWHKNEEKAVESLLMGARLVTINSVLKNAELVHYVKKR